ncbi:MAG: NfeD family protein [Actinomycetota bacterium]
MLLPLAWVMTGVIRAHLATPILGVEGMIGREGVARTDIVSEGRVLVSGTLWSARASGTPIPKGSKVKVRAVSGLVLVVELEGREESVGAS